MTKVIVILGFAVALVAGFVAGVRWQVKPPVVAGPANSDPAKQPTPPQPRGDWRPRDPGGWLAEQLKLTKEQQQKMQQIWSEAAGRGRDFEKKRWDCRKERDEAVKTFIAQLPSENKTAYEQIFKDYSEKSAEIEKEIRGGFEAAVQKTKEILTPEQREKYEAILKRGPGPWQRGGPGTREGGPPRGDWSPGPRRDHTHGQQDDRRATSRPATDRAFPNP